jgi:Zn-dependent alcohol dehydrogenase
MRFRAAMLHRAREPLRIETVELGALKPGDALVRIGAASLCHTDLEVIEGQLAYPMPIVLGHEAAGTVEALGPGVEGLARGDAVVLSWNPHCGHCFYCEQDQPILCETYLRLGPKAVQFDGTTRLSLDGAPVYHLMYLGAFAEYCVVPAQSAVRVPHEIPFDRACLIGCGVMTGVGAVINTAKVPAGSTVAVIGLGGVGLSSLLGGIAVGASRVVAVDLSDDKLGLARQLGATDTFNAGGANAVDEIRSATNGGVEYAFEMAGSVRAMDLAYKITRRGGTTVTAGLPPPTHTFNLPQVNLVAEERTVKGSYIGTCVPVRDLPRYIALYRRGKLPVDRLMSSHLKLADINLGFDRLHEGKAVRQVIVL